MPHVIFEWGIIFNAPGALLDVLQYEQNYDDSGS